MKRVLYIVLIVFLLGVFLVSGFLLVQYFVEGGEAQGRYDELAQLVQNAQNATRPIQEEDPQPGQPTCPPDVYPWVDVTDPETGETVQVLPEYAQLYEMNNDLVGWLSIPNTVINYPVMQTPDSVDYYLHRDFDKNYSSRGCLYAREQCDIFAPSDNITIYGHRMKDGSMFSALTGYQSKQFWEENSIISFHTLKERNRYQVFAVFLVSASIGTDFQYHLFETAAGEDDFNEFVETCRSLAIYDTGVDVSYGDKLITLSTCDYSMVNGRLVIVAKRIE